MTDILIEKKISDNLHWGVYKEVTFLHVDFRKTEDDLDVLEIIRDVMKVLDNESDYSVRILTDATDMDVSFNTQKTIRTMLKDYQHVQKKSAMTGVGAALIPFHKLYKIFTGSRAVLFRTYEEALEYLIAE